MMKAAIIGSGNLANHLLPKLVNSNNVFINCLYSRNHKSGLHLCKEMKIAFANSFASIPEDTSMVLLMVNDSAIQAVTKELSLHLHKETIMVHFSGATELKAIDPYFNNSVGFWPIQTISSSDRALDFQDIPFCVTGTNDQSIRKVVEVFKEVSCNILSISEEEKLKLHLAAVFANNFTNHLFHLSKQILDKMDVDFDVLRPIIKKTAENVMKLEPGEVQTGPAIRNDQLTIDKHLKILQDQGELKSIYQILTESIQNNRER